MAFPSRTLVIIIVLHLFFDPIKYVATQGIEGDGDSNETISDGIDEIDRATIRITSVEIFEDERPDFSFLQSPELYMFCLPDGTI